MNDCIFCKIVAGEIGAEQIHETAKVLAFADIAPINLGHTLVILKKHSLDILETQQPLFLQLMTEVQQVARKVKEATGASGINIGINNGRAAGQIVDHLHVHVIPRFGDDGLQSWKRTGDFSKEEIAETAEKIRNA